MGGVTSTVAARFAFFPPSYGVEPPPSPAAAAHEARHRGGRHVRAAARGEAHTALLPRQRRRPRPDVRALRRARLPPQRQHHGVRPSLLLPQDRIEILSLLLATCYCAVCDALKLPELVNGV
jgi:hypothetical protein